MVLGIPGGFCLSTNPFEHSTDITIPIKGNHSTLGLSLALHPDNDCIILRECIPSTPAGRIPRWRSTIRDSTVITVNDISSSSIDNVLSSIAAARLRNDESVSFTLVTPERVNIHPGTNVPQIHFDQLNVMAFQHNAARNDTTP
mmetsp:Transcript_21547/g.25679  ORF Transcript_21547/g.25679 Transcript_21547/m.25679 type:complete len:144 (+) Transcript_21547:643-1074(+)